MRHYIFEVSDDQSRNFPFDCKCIGTWNFWPGTRLTVNKLKRHMFVCVFTTLFIFNTINMSAAYMCCSNY